MGSEILLIGAESLLGKEVRDKLERESLPRPFRAATLAAEATAVFAAREDEIEVVATAGPDMIRDAAAIVAVDHAAETLRLAREYNEAAPIVDLSGALRSEPGAVLRAPRFESRPPAASIHSLPHPAAWLLALLLNDLHEAQPITRAVATIFEPASALGQSGIDELQKQTVALLSFKKLPSRIYDAQLSFNLLPRLGEEAPTPLAPREDRIRGDLTALAQLHGSGLPVPSIRLVQTPTFHGYAVSVWVEFAARPNLTAIVEHLARERVDVRTPDVEPPSNIGVAGMSGYVTGAIETDPNHPSAAWFWAAADNFTLQADLAIEILREML